MGLVGFAGTATLYHAPAPAGPAFAGLNRAVQLLHPRDVTNLAAGLTLALDQLAKVRADRRNIVVITDGAANVDVACLPGAISRAQASRVRIFTIGIGNAADSDYDRDLLVNMARWTGGRFSSAHSFQALCQALRRAG